MATGASFACESAQIAPYVLVVTVPPLAPGGGSTFVVSSDQLAPIAPANACRTGVAPGVACFKLPAPRSAAGAYAISGSQAESAGWYLGDLSSAMSVVTLPVSVTFWPQWTPFDTGVRTDVRLLNLPVPPVYGTNGNILYGVYGFPPGGHAGEPPLEWMAGLSLPLAYVADVQVLTPFDAAYPDLSYAALTVPTTLGLDDPSLSIVLGQGLTVVQQPPQSAPPFTVRRADGQPFAEGWSLYFRDTKSQQRLTSRAPVTGPAPQVRLNSLGNGLPLPASAELVLEPPLGLLGAPELRGPGGIGTVVTYPALPPLARLSGVVESVRGAPVSATLLFSSKLVDDSAACAAGHHTSSTNLFYEARTATADQIESGGVVGEFNVVLPQGTYSVVVVPSAASGYAKSSISYVSVPPEGSQVCAGVSVPAAAAVVVSDPVPVDGVVRTADGRPLANASVDMTPASRLSSGRVLGRDTPSVFEDSWPRPSSTTTGESGTFHLDVDPGEYDVTVRPQPGTGFPWLVRPDHLVMAPTTLAPLVIPAPVPLDLRIHGSVPPADFPLVSVTVQAFSFYNGAAVAIGEATTDADGHLRMMLSTAFPRE